MAVIRLHVPMTFEHAEDDWDTNAENMLESCNIITPDKVKFMIPSKRPRSLMFIEKLRAVTKIWILSESEYMDMYIYRIYFK